MLANLNLPNKKFVLHPFNTFYLNAYVTEEWRRAIVIPLLKPGMPADEASSYRTISLTSCLGKPFEKLVINSFNWFVEHNRILGPEQAGFRKKTKQYRPLS